jgi:transposase
MSLSQGQLPQDIEQLSRMVRALDAENADLKAEVDYLKRLIHGARSEKLATIDPVQTSLDLGDLSDIPVAANDDRPQNHLRHISRRSSGRNIGALPKHLPRYDVVIEPECQTCSCCAGELHRVGETTSEALDIVPAILRVKRTIRPRYACRACTTGITQAPVPVRFMDGGMATTALAAHIVTSKFAWHLPLYRQAQIFAGHGIALDRGTLGSWVTRVAWWLEPLYDRLLAFIRSQPRVFSDETRLPRLDPGRKRTKVCQLWAQAVDDRPWNGPAPPAVGYIFSESRSAREAERQLASFNGILQVDGYAAYKTLAKRRGKSNARPLRLAFCLAHARRKFVEVVKLTGSSDALEIVSILAEIYLIEQQIRGESAEERYHARQSRSAAIMRSLKAHLLDLKADISTQSALAKAINYTLKHWTGLTAFLDDGTIEVDSNVVERSMKSVALTRKNSMFVGNARGGETFAILASLVNSAKLNGLDPQTWLADVLERIVSGRTTINQLDTLLPWNWSAEQVRQAA